ncbi:MAG: tyrosyl-tRNA synthetase, partial [Firmicutes bacterium]|nr:tyrosyl-tRNA synthetase [Bacillota bacterium]
ELREQMEQGRNPRDVKLELAQIITKLYHSPDEMERAQEYFHTVFQRGEIPEKMPEISVSSDSNTLTAIIPVLLRNGIIPSGSEFRRLVKQGGVQVNLRKIENLEEVFNEKQIVMRIGKKKFVRIMFITQKNNEILFR